MHKCSLQKRCKEDQIKKRVNIANNETFDRCIDATAITGNQSPVLHAKIKDEQEIRPKIESKQISIESMLVADDQQKQRPSQK